MKKIEFDGEECPCCGGRDIEDVDIDISDYETVIVTYECENCIFRWVGVFSLDGGLCTDKEFEKMKDRGNNENL